MTRFWPLALALLPLLSSCAVDAARVPAPTPTASPSVVAATVEATPRVDATPAAPASPTPEPSVATPVPTPAPPKIGYRYWKDPATPEPLPTLSAEQQATFGACLPTVVAPGTSGACARLVQTELKRLGYHNGAVASSLTAAATNSVLRYQRSRDLKPTGIVNEQTWYALASGKPARSEALPYECTLPGVVLCVDQGHDKLRFVKDGEVLRTVRIRTGGYTTEPKTGKWRVHATVNGYYRVFDKQVSPKSENYGSGAMPYSIMFDPNMYVHYSTPFARQGYSSSSHGCVNVASLEDIKWLFKNTPVGAHVLVY